MLNQVQEIKTKLAGSEGVITQRVFEYDQYKIVLDVFGASVYHGVKFLNVFRWRTNDRSLLEYAIEFCDNR